MKSQALQQMVKRIFGDAQTKQQFLADPHSIMSGFSLTGPEKKAVLKVHDQLGLVSSGSTQMEAVLKPTVNWWSAPLP